MRIPPRIHAHHSQIHSKWQDPKESDLEWAIKQAHARFCPVGAMLGKAVELDYKWEVV